MAKLTHCIDIFLPDEKATLQLGATFCQLVDHITLLYLYGEPGAGKTTFSRAFIQALGYRGKVKSPTYTLVEPYQIQGRKLYHFDLYRLLDAEELEFIGIRDYINASTCCLIEWPERGAGVLPDPSFSLTFNSEGNGRRVFIQAFTASHAFLLKQLGV